MFPDQFLPNAATAVLGIAVALFWLRTGMAGRGLALLATISIAADVALVARFVFGNRDAWYFGGLWTLQVAAVGSGTWLGLALARRHWSADARRRDELFAAAFQHYLRDELPPARGLFRRILRADPWDAAASVGLANVRWRLGQTARALALLRRARRLDRRGRYDDFIAEQARRMRPGPRQPATAAPPVAADR